MRCRPRHTPAPRAALTRRSAAAKSSPPPARSGYAGYLAVPDNPRGIVVFAHGSGSGRHSARNRHVAGILNDAGLGTLLFDLLTPGEELHRANVFDIGLLAGRLAEVTGWLRAQPGAAAAAIGYFGASTGAAAALWAAAEPGAGIAAVVSRGGRPDLARPRLAAVTAPTLLIVGGARRGGAGSQPPGPGRAALREPPGGGARRQPSVRGAGHPRRGRRAGPGLVHQPPHALAPASDRGTG